MTNSATGSWKTSRSAAADTDKNPVYKTVVRELRTLQTAVESPSGAWTLIKDRSPATGGLNQKRK